MRRLPLSPRTPQQVRAGFSLVELMIVIVVIGILIGMAFPAYNAVQRRAQITAVVVEIKNLEEAIARFEQQYGAPPPSFVVIPEGGSSPSVTSANKWPPSGGSPNARISRARLKAIWPQLDFSTYGEPYDYNADGDTSDGGEDDGGIDLNGDGDIDDLHVLNGAECLVFFLGGVCVRADIDGDGVLDFVPTGFSTNPKNPFIVQNNAAGIAAGSRTGPFYQFDPKRLVDLNNNGFPEYLDSLPTQTKPYQYFSSYGGTGYLPRGLDDDHTTAADNESVPGGLLSHYILSDTNTSGMGYPTPPSDSAVHKPQGYQIISPGYDGEYGVGGAYVSGKAIPTTPDPTGLRATRIQEEWDNITNFATGTLQ